MKQPTGRPVAFVLAATAQGTLLVNRHDYGQSGGQLYGVGHQLLSSGAYDAEEVRLLLTLLNLRRTHFGAGVIASIAQTPVPFATDPELVGSIATALAGAAGYPEILGLTHGHPYFDNVTTQYTGALPAPLLAFINANVQRFSGSPAGRNAIEKDYTPTGDLKIPALTLSTFRDPVVPGFHRTIYGQTVAAAGNADLLVQRSVAGYTGGYGHCTFTPQELTQAFFDLVVWGEYGIKPTP